MGVQFVVSFPRFFHCLQVISVNLMFVRPLKGATLSCTKHYSRIMGSTPETVNNLLMSGYRLLLIACYPKIPTSQRLKGMFVVMRRGNFLTSVYITFKI